MEHTNRDNLWPGWKTLGLLDRYSEGALYEIQRKSFGKSEKAALKVISIPRSRSSIENLSGSAGENIAAALKQQVDSTLAGYSLMRQMGESGNVVRCEEVRHAPHNDGLGWDIYVKLEQLTPLVQSLSEEFSEKTVVKLGMDICRALDTCGEYNIVHRDVKPQNIFLSAEGDYKLGEFCMIRTADQAAVGENDGVHMYSAPEAFNNQPCGAAADIYSLGLILYWLLNERRMPFLPLPPEIVRADMSTECSLRRLQGEPLPPPAHGSYALKAVVMKACAYKPADRFSSPREMWLALQSALRDEAPLRGTPAKNSRTKRRRWNLVALLFVVFAAVALVLPRLIPADKNDLPADADRFTPAGTAQSPSVDTPASLPEEQKEALATPDAPAYAEPAQSAAYTSVNVYVGDSVYFGEYEQDGNTSNGPEDIEWIVLGKDGDVLFLISRYCLDAKPYNNYGGDAVWATSSMRFWLNDSFYNSAFNASEQSMILSSTVRTPGQSAVTDAVYLLSVSEAESYFYSETGKKTAATEYAKSRGVYINAENGDTYWWLRDSGTNQDSAARVFTWGEPDPEGKPTDAGDGGVRPVLQVDLSANSGNILRRKESVALVNAQVGDYVRLGTYEQDGNTANGSEDIEWIVLDKNGNRLLVLSRYCLEGMAFNNTKVDTTWATSSIRQWLNGTFLNCAFDAIEQERICSVSLGNPLNPETGVGDTAATDDQIFLLAARELDIYLPEVSSRIAAPTRAARDSNINYNTTTRTSWWWLRTSAEDRKHASFVFASGEGEYDAGYSVSESTGGVRPAMWLEIP